MPLLSWGNKRQGWKFGRDIAQKVQVEFSAAVVYLTLCIKREKADLTNVKKREWHQTSGYLLRNYLFDKYYVPGTVQNTKNLSLY